MATQYDQHFYTAQDRGALESARIVLPIVLDLVRPRSVIDVGCGGGAWTRVLKDHVPEVVSVDGDWVPEALRLPGFEVRDLEVSLDLDRKFDLVVCAEVAEHLSPTRAESFVEDLVRLGRNVLFSAAIPNQGGVDHRNERWQSYWASLFAQHGLYPHDVVRPKVWSDEGVETWYRQNMLLYTDEPSHVEMLDLVHPSLLTWVADWQPWKPKAVRSIIRAKIRKLMP